MASPDTCVWFEIPVGDLERARLFYGAVLKRDLAVTEGGPNPMVALTDIGAARVSGHLYPGEAAPGTGPTIHRTSPDGIDADRPWLGPAEAPTQRRQALTGQVVSA